MIGIFETSVDAPHMLKAMGAVALGMSACKSGGKGCGTGGEVRGKGRHESQENIVRVISCGGRKCYSGLGR